MVSTFPLACQARPLLSLCFHQPHDIPLLGNRGASDSTVSIGFDWPGAHFSPLLDAYPLSNELEILLPIAPLRPITIFNLSIIKITNLEVIENTVIGKLALDLVWR